MNYTKLVDDQRRRHIRGGFGWPGKPVRSDAVTRYPNIAAELAASGYWLCTLAEFANVSPEIMAAVIEDGEALTGEELWRLSYRWEGRGPGYLSAPVLQTVDPNTRKGKRRRRELADLIQTVEAAPGFHFHRKRETYGEYGGLKEGTPVTYAAYWWVCHAVKEALAAEHLKSGPRDCRTERGATT